MIDRIALRTAKIDAENADLHRDGFIGGFYIRVMPTCNKGDFHDGHEHYIDHPMNLIAGAVRIEWRKPATGQEGVVDVLVPCKVLIKADTWHKITALEDDTRWECWFSEAEAEKVHGHANLAPWHLEKPVDG